MASKQTDTVAMTEEQLDTVVGGYNNGQDAADHVAVWPSLRRPRGISRSGTNDADVTPDRDRRALS